VHGNDIVKVSREHNKFFTIGYKFTTKSKYQTRLLKLGMFCTFLCETNQAENGGCQLKITLPTEQIRSHEKIRVQVERNVERHGFPPLAENLNCASCFASWLQRRLHH
jgi:hypothetical protein